MLGTAEQSTLRGTRATCKGTCRGSHGPRRSIQGILSSRFPAVISSAGGSHQAAVDAGTPGRGAGSCDTPILGHPLTIRPMTECTLPQTY